MKKIFFPAALLLAWQSILSGQCLSTPTCPPSPITYCDVTPNDAQFWNDSLFYDPVVLTHDLAEVPADMPVQITSSCGAADIAVSFVLRLDLDFDGVQETVVTSNALPVADTIYFGNANNPNFSGGIPRHFDLRPVPADQKYGFALEKTVLDSVLTVRLRWVTAQQPGTYVVPQLPSGTHRIDWYFEQNGQAKTCGYLIVGKDCKAPNLVCSNNPIVNMSPNLTVHLSAEQYLQSAVDNITPSAQLRYGIRRSGTGSGFPVDGNGNTLDSVLFKCSDLGVQTVEIWAMDLAGNAEYCESNLIIQDTSNYCMNLPPTYVCAKGYCYEQGISGVDYYMVFDNPFHPSDSSGCSLYLLNTNPPPNPNLKISAGKNDHPTEGLNTLDMILIFRHILGLDILDSPYKLIAADVDRNGVITPGDIKEERKMLFGIYQEWPNNAQWRFVDKSFVFPNPAQPLQTPFPEYVTFGSLQAGPNDAFRGTKIGDVDCSVSAAHTPLSQAALSIPNLSMQADEIVDIPVSFAEAHEYFGLQFGLRFDPGLIQLVGIMPAAANGDDFWSFPGLVEVSSAPIEKVNFSPDLPVFYLRMRALTPLHLADIFSLEPTALPAEAYPALTIDSLARLYLQFATVATSEPGAAEAIGDPQPNPTSAGIRIPLRLEGAAPAVVEIMDGTGRLLYRREETGVPGAQSLEVPAAAFPQSGVYFWRVQLGKVWKTGKIMKQ